MRTITAMQPMAQFRDPYAYPGMGRKRHEHFSAHLCAEQST
jgi:hypothetical protein